MLVEASRVVAMTVEQALDRYLAFDTVAYTDSTPLGCSHTDCLLAKDSASCFAIGLGRIGRRGSVELVPVL